MCGFPAKPPWGLGKTPNAGFHFQSLSLEKKGVGLRMCISDMFPCDTKVAGPHFEEDWFIQLGVRGSLRQRIQNPFSHFTISYLLFHILPNTPATTGVPPRLSEEPLKVRSYEASLTLSSGHPRCLLCGSTERACLKGCISQKGDHMNSLQNCPLPKTPTMAVFIVTWEDSTVHTHCY